jgi:DNA-binding NarL/FixJ family response regulator
MVVLDDRELFAGLMIDAGEAVSHREPAGDPGTPPSLTPRQQTVLGMLVDGKPARAIATELQLSEMTVRNHIRAILRALGCTSQLAAVAKARRLRLDLPEPERQERLGA